VDIGHNHADRQLVRDVLERPVLRLVPHIGYVSLFPFMGKIIPSVSNDPIINIMNFYAKNYEYFVTTISFRDHGFWKSSFNSFQMIASFGLTMDYDRLPPQGVQVMLKCIFNGFS